MCGVKLCGMCTFRTLRDSQKCFTCIACLGEKVFYESLKEKARTVAKETEDAIEGINRLTQFEMQGLFFEFCETVDVLNRLVMYSDLETMWPLLLRIVKYQKEHNLEGHLGTLQAVGFHAEPRTLHSELVQQVALVNARWKINERLPKKIFTKRKTPTLAVALHEVDRLSPILQRLAIPLQQLLKRAQLLGDLKVHVLATQKVNIEVPQVRDLHVAFSDAGCWNDMFEEKTGVLSTKPTPQELAAKFKRTVRQLGIDVLVDGIGSSALGSEGFCSLCIAGSEARFIFDFLNSPVLPRNPQLYTGVILDPVLSQAVPDEDSQDTDRFCCISCWQPPVMDCIRGLNRSQRPVFKAGNGQNFFILTPVDLSQISRELLLQLLDLLVALPDAILCFYGAPLTQISATELNLQLYTDQNHLDKNYFDGRVDWWGRRPMEDHGQRMRDKVHVCCTFGPASDHTGVTLALCVGVPVVTEQGLRGGGDISSWAATSMLNMAGLGALAVSNGSGLAGDLIRQFYHDGELLAKLQRILDNQATSSTGFFDNERTANDLAALVIAHHLSSDSNPPARDFISRHAELPYYELDHNGKLQPTARVLVREGEDQLGAEVQLEQLYDMNAVECAESGWPPPSHGADAEMVNADAGVNDSEGGVGWAAFGEPPWAGDLLGSEAVWHPGPVPLTRWMGRRWRGRGRGQRRPRR